MLLSKNKIICEKIPSSTPLYCYYKKVVSDYVGITAPFHLEEYKELKNNWYIKKILKRPHEYFNDFIKIDKNINTLKYDIAYISSGYSLRRQKGMRCKSNLVETEAKILHILSSIIKQNNTLNLVILLHPIEKQNIYIYNKVKKYYSNFFNKPVSFGAFKVNSLYYFTQIDLTVTITSNLNIQRLLNGFKGIYAPLEKDYPFRYCSSLRKVIINTPDELESKIN